MPSDPRRMNDTISTDSIGDPEALVRQRSIVGWRLSLWYGRLRISV